MSKLVPSFIFVFAFNLILGQDREFCQELEAIANIVEKEHYQPKTINDSLSHSVFKLFLNTIDENQKLFLKEDIQTFKKDQFSLAHYILEQDCSFMFKYTEIYQQRIAETSQILNDLKSKSLDYSGRDSLYYYNDDRDRYFSNREIRADYWNKHVRFEILRKVVETGNDIGDLKSTFDKLEPDVKVKVIENELCLLNEKKQHSNSIQDWIEHAFFNAFLNAQDPNSFYLTPSNKIIFENSLNNTEYTFGVSTEKGANGDITIAYIVPGSPAYKSGEIDKNDKIISLISSEDVLETYCVSSETVNNFINDGKHEVLDFKIKKRNGQVKTVRLKKAKISNEDNTITGFVIESEDRIGYIEIPSFYTDMESANGLGVANDVAKQIYKLQREDISALIIDLRYNGGGSMKEAADLSGMFIDRGPVAITAYRDEENYTLRDPNRGVIIYKPVVVLVSQFSASASELFAGVLQDYNSAVIIGSTTHGKATSQQVLSVDQSKDSNFVKLTVGQFFRVNGRSHQKTGVIPDIILPNIYDQIKTQEAYRANALPSDSVEVTLSHRPNTSLNLDNVRVKSQKRVQNNIVFNSITKANTIFVNDYVNKEGVFPLTLEYVFQDLKRYGELWENYESVLSNDVIPLIINNTPSTESIISYNEDQIELNKIQRDVISRDPYIYEAVNIILDILKYN